MSQPSLPFFIIHFLAILLLFPTRLLECTLCHEDMYCSAANRNQAAFPFPSPPFSSDLTSFSAARSITRPIMLSRTLLARSQTYETGIESQDLVSSSLLSWVPDAQRCVGRHTQTDTDRPPVWNHGSRPARHSVLQLKSGTGKRRTLDQCTRRTLHPHGTKCSGGPVAVLWRSLRSWPLPGKLASKRGTSVASEFEVLDAPS